MKNEINEFILSRIIIDLSKIKQFLEDGNYNDAKSKIDTLLENIQEIPIDEKKYGRQYKNSP